MKTRNFIIGWALIVLLVGACPVLAEEPIFSYDFEGCIDGALLGQDNPAWGLAYPTWGSLAVADVVGADGNTSKAVHRDWAIWTTHGTVGNVRDWPTSEQVSFTSADTAVWQSYQFKPNPDGDFNLGIFGGAKFGSGVPNYYMTFGVEKCPASGNVSKWYLRSTDNIEYRGDALATDNWHEVKLVMNFSATGGRGTLYYRDLETPGAVWTQDSSIVNKPMNIAQTAGEYVVTGLKFYTSEGVGFEPIQPAGWIDNYTMGVSAPLVKPLITKLGTIDCDMVETTPVVFNNKLYRFESVRVPEYWDHDPGATEPYFRFVDVAASTTTPSFASGYDLGSAFVKDGTMYVYGMQGWGTSTIYEFSSTDLETWSSPRAVLTQPTDWEIYNTSVCKAEGERYVMAIEVGKPTSVVGTPFTTRFAESTDLVNWTLLPEGEGVYTKDKYVACPALRFLDDGYFYMIHLEHIKSPRSYESHIVRSTDLVNWESSPLNPVLQFSDEDRLIHPDFNPTPEQLARIASEPNCNNSDVDLCEFDGKVYLYYCWGDQYAYGSFLAEAVYEGTLDSFLRGFFEPPEPIPGDANDDGIVNDEDASILAAHWQQSGAEIGWGDGDFNGDNIVNDADASILAANWQSTGEAGAPVPEPAMLVLLAGGLVTLLLWRRK